MAARRSRTPYLTSRVIDGPDGEGLHLYRWTPGPALRKAGFRGVDLWADGPPLNADQCRALGFAERIDLRGKGAAPLAPKPAAATARRLTAAARDQMAGAASPATRAARRPAAVRTSIRALCADYLAAQEQRRGRGDISASRLKQIRAAMTVFAAAGAEDPPGAATKESLRALYDWLRDDRGEAMAYSIMSTVVTMFIWAEGRDAWRGRLPPAECYTRLRMRKPPARIRVAQPAEIEALMTAFDDPARLYAELGVPLAERVLAPAPSLGDALVAMLWSAARVGDALSFTRDAMGGDGRLRYRQQKTGAAISVPILPPLAARLPGMRRRAATLAPDAEAIIIDETNGRPYWRARRASGMRDHKPFTDRYKLYRALAGQIEPSLIGEGVNAMGEPIPAFNAQDCRDTAMTRLSLATESLAELAAWHGSSIATIAKISKAYIDVMPEHADKGGEKLIALCRDLDIAV